jgi:hypothetical protein
VPYAGYGCSLIMIFVVRHAEGIGVRRIHEIKMVHRKFLAGTVY